MLGPPNCFNIDPKGIPMETKLDPAHGWRMSFLKEDVAKRQQRRRDTLPAQLDAQPRTIEDLPEGHRHRTQAEVKRRVEENAERSRI